MMSVATDRHGVVYHWVCRALHVPCLYRTLTSPTATNHSRPVSRYMYQLHPTTSSLHHDDHSSPNDNLKGLNSVFSLKSNCIGDDTKSRRLDPTIRQPGFDLPRQQWSLLNRFRTEQGHCGACRRKCVLVARPRRCLTLSNPVPWQNWMAAYLGYTLRMRTLFRGWPIMVNDTHTRRRRPATDEWADIQPNRRTLLSSKDTTISSGHLINCSVTCQTSYLWFPGHQSSCKQCC